MPSFQPGTRVLARLTTKKHIWRIAKVVEPDPDQDPDTITVSFVGKTDKVKLPSKDVKLQPEHPNNAPTVDLTVETDRNELKNSTHVHPTAALPSFSDPWDRASQTRSIIPQSEHVKQTSPIRSFSDSRSNIPHAHAHRPLTHPQQSTLANTKQSSRSWLLAQHATERDRAHTFAPSEQRLCPPQRQPQVVRDPSFPDSRYPANPRDNLELPSWELSHELPISAQPSSSFQHGREDNFVPFPQKGHPQSFQFTPIRADATCSQTLRPPASTVRSPGGQMPLRPTIPRRFSNDEHHATSATGTTAMNAQIYSHPRPARLLGSSKPVSSAPLKNGLTTRDHERHPLRSVDEHLRIPRAAAAQKVVTRVPRHPQSSFDDDVPIPRNTIRPRFANNAMVQDGANTDAATGLYPAIKRQRVRYDMLARDQMPPSFQTEAVVCMFSRRLAKREKEQGRIQEESSREYLRHSLPYQRPLQRENGIIKIAPTFTSSKAFAEWSEAISDEEANVLRGIFADLSVSTGDIDLDNDDSLLLRMKRSISPLVVRSGGRKKSYPKQRRGDKRAVVRAYSSFNIFESGVGSSSVQDHVAAPLRELLPASSTGEQGNVKNCPMPRIYGCSCQDESEELGLTCDERPSIQCCMCTLWSHMTCTGLQVEEARALREGAANGKEKYICMQCVDEQVALRSVDKVPRHQAFDDGAKWISSVHSVSERIAGLNITRNDTVLHSSHVDDRCRRGCAWIREPLVPEEIRARVSNLEQLREGVTNASVGAKERILFDNFLGDRRCTSVHTL